MRRHQANRPCAVNRNALTRKQSGQLSCMPTSRENIREHDVVIFSFLGVLRQHQAVEIRIRNAEQFRLTALVGPHLSKAVSGAGRTGIGCQAESREPFFAVLTEPAADVEWQADAITNFDPVDSGAHLNHFAEVFMAKNSTCLERRAAFVHVQVRTADVGRGDTHQYVGGLLDFCVRNILDRDVTWAVVHDGFHVELPKSGATEKRPTLFR